MPSKYSHYEEVPRELADRIISTAKAEKEANAAHSLTASQSMSGHSAVDDQTQEGGDGRRPGKVFTKYP